jgi:hypothetical protein
MLCQNLESEIQGDGNTINIIGLQKGGGSEFDELLSGMDEQQLLSAFEWLKANGFDKSSSFAIISINVAVILSVII